MHSPSPFLPSSLSFLSFVLRSQSVRMQENRYRHFSLIRAFQSQRGRREEKEKMLCVYLLLFRCPVESYHLRTVYHVRSILHSFQLKTPVVIIMFVSNYTLWRMYYVTQWTLEAQELKSTLIQTFSLNRLDPQVFPLHSMCICISGKSNTQEASSCMWEKSSVCLSVHWHVFLHVFASVCVCEVFLDR